MRQWIERNGYTRERLARELDVHPRTIYRWLDGSVAIPRAIELALKGLETK